MTTVTENARKGNSKAAKQTTPPKPSKPLLSTAPQPAKSKPAAPLTPEQKIRRLEDANTQLRKELAAADKRHSDLADRLSVKLDALEKAASGKILEATREFSAYDFKKAVTCDLTSGLIVKLMDCKKFHRVYSQGAKAAFGNLSACYPELHMISHALSNKLQNMGERISELHEDALYCGAFASQLVDILRL